jgi:valyl-tRNA synthetase
LADRWILSRYYRVVQRIGNYIDDFGLGEAAKELYEFIWGDFCDWYIELVKSRLQSDSPTRRVAQQTLAQVLEGILRLLHPFMPHITEEVWHTVTQSGTDRSLAQQTYPKLDDRFLNPELEQQFELLFNTIRIIRNLRAEADIKPGAKIPVSLQTESDRERHTLTLGQSYIQDLAKVDQLTIASPTSSSLTSPPSTPSIALAQRLTSKGLVSTLLLLLGVFLGGKVLINLYQSLHQLPILPTLFELTGLAYTTWFVYRYLWRSSDRQTLASTLKTWQSDILGTTLPNSSVDASTPDSTSMEVPSSPQTVMGVVGTVQVMIPLAGLVDVEALRAKLQRELTKVEAELSSLSDRLNNPNFVNKAPADVVETAKTSLLEAEKQSLMLRAKLQQL